MRSWLPFPDMRTISLEIGQIMADEAVEQPSLEPDSSRG
jgi:hypothetical protein